MKMQTSNLISGLSLIVSLIACAISAASYHHTVEQDAEKIRLTASSIDVVPFVTLANEQPIFQNKISATFNARNGGEHRVFLRVSLFRRDATIFVDGKELARRNDLEGPGFQLDRDETAKIELRSQIGASFTENEALTNIYRLHGPDVDRYLHDQKQSIFNFGGSIYADTAWNCDPSSINLKDENSSSHEIAFGLSIISDEGTRASCYIVKE